MEWTIQDLGAIGELVGALGVITTLGYLAYQIRQNTAQLEQSTVTAKAAAVKASNNALRSTRQTLYETAEMAELFLRGNGDPEALEDVPRLRYRLVMQNVADTLWDIYTQAAVTGFSPETWATQGVTLIERVFSTRGGRWFWAAHAGNYPRSFRAEVDRVLDELSRRAR